MLITVGDGKIKLVGVTSGRPRDAASIHRPPRGMAYDSAARTPMFGGGTAALLFETTDNSHHNPQEYL